MNPPSVLQGAMSRERKPFTYTPGGLDLSEIKSERMAKRLMRNAMNQGVPEVPVHHIQSPQTPSTPIAVPNFNCLPVQVFPAMPANPRSLLRTRSHPEHPKEPIIQRPQSNQHENTYNQSLNKQNPLPSLQKMDKPAVDYQPPFNNNYNGNINNRPVTMFEYNTTPGNYGSVNFTAPILPEISYEVEYLQAPKHFEKNNNTYVSEIINNNFSNCTDDSVVIKSESKEADNVMAPETVTVFLESKEDQNSDSNDQREVRVVKKKENKVEDTETKTENQNGNHNGLSESAVTVKIPPKKAAAKTETKVEVVKRTLSDGSVEEVKTTTTKTTVNGKTQITTKIETTVIPKEDDEEYEEIEVEEEQEEDVQTETIESEATDEPTTVVILKQTGTSSSVEDKERSSVIVTEEESSEIVSSKKVTVTQNNDEVELEEEVKEEAEEVNNNSEIESTVNTVVNQNEEIIESNSESKEKEQEEEEATVVVSVKLNEQRHEETKTKQETVIKNEVIQKQENGVETEDGNESEYTEEEYESEVEHTPNDVKKDEKPVQEIPKPSETKDKEENETHEAVFEDTVSQEVVSQETVSSEAVLQETLSKESVSQEIVSHTTISQETVSQEGANSSLKPDEVKPNDQETTSKPIEANVQQEHNIEISYSNIPLREPSIPLEKVEDVEIKPIGAQTENISKTQTENTEIITSSNDKSSGVLSAQTEYNRVENIVTVNRTTKTLDQSYEQLTTQGQPTTKTYFAPNRESVSISPSKPYQPTFTPEPQPERRHSLLLERLSLERQTPTIDSGYQNTYQYTNQGFEHQRQWSQEPQSEVLNVSNVKPSKITNQEWFQQSRKENVTYSDETAPGTLNIPLHQFNQPQPQSQPIPSYQPPPPPKPQPQPQPQYQQPQYQPTQKNQQQSQYHYQAQFQPKPTPPTQAQYQTPNVTSQVQDFSRTSSSVYEKHTSFPPYIPTPATQNTWENNVSSFSSNTQSNQYSFSNQTSSETYQKSSQNYSSSYVPPPWEQDSTYNSEHSYQYQPSTPAPNVAPAPPLPTTNNQHWKPQTTQGKFSKTTPASYTPPAPNQSFVKTDGVIEPPSLPGRKTYYSEYERRYITVPESTYIPAETKFQAQPDPSPQYYFDKNEPVEPVEPQWRKELREFTEKSQTYQSEQISVRPPWEEEVQYAKNPSVKYTPTPSWSQTLRPQSWRERSFEADSVATQDFTKTSTLGRGRPLSTYSTNEVENQSPRSRGVSVDRYNPVYYRSPVPSEHSPVQVQTLTPETAPQRKGHQHPVPAFNARASAEPRDPSAQFQQKRNREVKENPVQSRSFKYLQWITGTED